MIFHIQLGYIHLHSSYEFMVVHDCHFHFLVILLVNLQADQYYAACSARTTMVPKWLPWYSELSRLSQVAHWEKSIFVPFPCVREVATL